MLKTFKIAAIAVAMGIAGAGAALAETVKIGFSADPYVPFTSLDASGKFVGWEVEFKDAICKQANLDCQIVLVSWDGIIPALTSKKIDLIIGSMSITDERKKVIDFTDKYYDTPAVVIANKNDKIGADAESLSGKSVAVLVSTIHQQYALAHFKSSEIKEYQTQDEMYQDLAAGRVDAVIADAIAVQPFLKSDPCCELKGNLAEDASILGAGVGIGLRQGETDLKNRLNDAIKAIRADGTYDAFSKKYFDFDIYGGK
ncbi:transporter substrate-binding domain-containing protein [Rhizobium sp. RAF56]|uniref:transporter substrate-binding domain-containing protein n=1 Tax=Rhizobium sp. RAF56 TaxID=3233062 RepID=UPI003F968BE2